MVLRKGSIVKNYDLTGSLNAYRAAGGVPLWDSRTNAMITPSLILEDGTSPLMVITCPGFQTIISYEVFQQHFVRLSGKRLSEQYTPTEWKYGSHRVKPSPFPKKVEAAISTNSAGTPVAAFVNYTVYRRRQPTLRMNLHVFHALFTEASE